MRNGSAPVARSKARPSRVNGSTGVPFSFQPCTVPQLRRSVNVASGYTLVPSAAKRACAMRSVACAHRRLDAVLVGLAHRARVRIDVAPQLRSSDQSTRRPRRCRPSTAPCARRDRRACCSVTTRLREVGGRFLRQQLAHHRMIGAQPLAHALQAVAEAQRSRAPGRPAAWRRAAARCAAARHRCIRGSAWRWACRARRCRAPGRARNSPGGPGSRRRLSR